MTQEQLDIVLKWTMSSPCSFIVVFVLMWLGISLLLSYFSGWRELALYYRYRNEVVSKKKYCQSASMRMVNYGSCLTVGGNEQGLYLSVWAIFSLGSPNLFKPWEDLKIVRKKYFWLFPVLELSVLKTPSIKIVFSQSIEKFFKEAHGKWGSLADE